MTDTTSLPVQNMQSTEPGPSQIWQGLLLSSLLGLVLALGCQWQATGNWLWLSQLNVNSLNWKTWLPIGLFGLGWVLGGILLWVDEHFSRQLYESGPITRSIGFLAVLVIISSFVITTSGSGLGIGLVLSLMTNLWVEILIWQNHPAAFRERFLHDIQTQAAIKLERQWQGKWGLMAGLIWLILVLLLVI